MSQQMIEHHKQSPHLLLVSSSGIDKTW